MKERSSLRISATLLFVGIVISLLAGILHPGRENPNNHVAVFAEYASADAWTAVHLGQFVGMAIIISGLLALFFALDVNSGVAIWTNRFGAVSAAVALALYGVLQAIDGVALKQAVDAWARAPVAEKAARFASAETIRWMEWAVRSYQSFTLGLALILFGIAILWTARTPKVIGYLMGLTGLAYIAQGWVLGYEGFSENNSAPTLVAYVAWLVWSIWLLIISWRMKESGKAAVA